MNYHEKQINQPFRGVFRIFQGEFDERFLFPASSYRCRMGINSRRKAEKVSERL